MATKLEKLNKDLSDLLKKQVALETELVEKNREAGAAKDKMGAAILDGGNADAMGAEVNRLDTRRLALAHAGKQNAERIAHLRADIAIEERENKRSELLEMYKEGEAKISELLRGSYGSAVLAKQLAVLQNNAAVLREKNDFKDVSILMQMDWQGWFADPVTRAFGTLENADMLELFKAAGINDWHGLIR